MDNLKQIAEDATQGINKLLIEPLSEEQPPHCYAAKNCPVVDKDTAYKIATAIRQKKDALALFFLYS